MTETKLAYVQERVDTLPLLTSTQFKGLRIDASFVDPVTEDQVGRFLIHVHDCCLVCNVGQKVNSSNLSSLFELPDYMRAAPSPSLLKREAEKIHRYSRLITIAQKQTTERKRLKTPTFAPFIISSFGDLSPQAVELQEWLVAAYGRNCERLGARSDGLSTAELVKSFRRRFKLNIQLAGGTDRCY